MANAIAKRSGRDTKAADELNEQFHLVLREAAAKREARARTQVNTDAAAAAEASRALFALARGRTEPETGLDRR